MLGENSMVSKMVKCVVWVTMSMALILVAVELWAEDKVASGEQIAVVNGVNISNTEFKRELDFYMTRASQQGQQIPEFMLPKVKDDILNNLIDRELLYQESQKMKITADSNAVAGQLASIKKRFQSPAEFEAAIKQLNLSETDIQSQISRDIAIRQLIDKQVAQKIVVSDEETKAYYDANTSQFKQPEQIKARHILIKIDADASETQKTDARKEITEIQQKLQNGGDFAGLAKEYSQGPSSVKGGDLGFFRRGQMVKPFEDAAFALKPNEISDIVETQFGYHLIKVEEKKPETTLAFTDIKDRLNQHLKEQKIDKEAKEYIDQLKKDAKIEKYL
jgi:peptidyl-prolyl cis-trans isomerase C